MQFILISGQWCTTCHVLAPVVKKICDDNKIPFTILDIEKDSDECLKYNPTSLPTLIYGDKRLTGAVTRQAIEAMIRA